MHNNSPASSSLIKTSDDPKEIVNNVNDFFVGIGEELAKKIVTNNNYSSDSKSSLSDIPIANHTMALFDTDYAEVGRIISELKTDSAAGWDGISTRILKDSRQVLIPPLTHIFNLCLNTGIFPKALKKALVLPIYKSGNSENVNNYRPISILPSISKILEKLLHIRLNSYLNKYNIISNKQYGFRKGISTDAATLDLTNTIVHQIDRKQKTIGIFLDLSKAFDTISIPKLLLKMEKLGMRGPALDIFNDYLSVRMQCVKIDSHISEDKLIKFGVPQGSILGPCLFTIYVNDLLTQSDIPNCQIYAYADDTALIINADTWNEAKSNADFCP